MKRTEREAAVEASSYKPAVDASNFKPTEREQPALRKFTERREAELATRMKLCRMKMAA